MVTFIFKFTNYSIYTLTNNVAIEKLVRSISHSFIQWKAENPQAIIMYIVRCDTLNIYFVSLFHW